MDVETYSEIINFLQSPEERRKWPKKILQESNTKGNFRKKTKPYLLQDGTLFYNHKKHGPLRVVKPDEVKTILKACHQDPLSGHQGVNRTWEKVKTRYHWPSMQKDVEQHVRECDPCQRQNHLSKTSSTLHPIPVKNKAFAMLGMDLVGPLKETAKGNKYLIVLTDYLTKWPEVKAIPEKTAKEIADFIIETISRHGTPEVILTDNGREFCNKLNDDLCQRLGIERRVTSPYHPQTNGLTERSNQTICNALIKFVNETQDDWDMYINQVAFAIRTCRQSSTKATPFYLTYGREAVLPIQLDIPSSPGQDASTEDFEELLNDRVTSFTELMKHQKDASIEIVKSQKQQKTYYDKRHEAPNLNSGDKVLVKNKKRINRKGDKLVTKWTGPYYIEACLGKGVFKLKDKARKVNVKDIKRYYEPAPLPSRGTKAKKIRCPQMSKQGSLRKSHSKTKLKKRCTPKPRSLLNQIPTKNRGQQKGTKKNVDQSKLQNSSIPLSSDSVHNYCDNLSVDVKQQIFDECSKHRIPRPSNPLTITSSMESPTFSLVMTADKVYEDDVLQCQNSLLKWYMTSPGNIGMASTLDPFILSAAVITMAFHSKTTPLDMLETLKEIPFRKDAPSSPGKIPKMTMKMKIGNTVLLRQDLCTLYQSQWLNDQVIHAYLGLLASEYNSTHQTGCYVLPCFLATKWESNKPNHSLWTFPKVALEDFEYVLLPVCHDHHWFLLVGSMTSRTVDVYDSLPCEERKERFCRHWINFMVARADKSVWKVGGDVSSKQLDSHSCGVFLLMNAEAILKGSIPKVMRHCHAKHYRRHILKRLLAEASPYQNRMCDLPYCTGNKTSQRQQCVKCQKKFHKKCLGLSESQFMIKCVFCSGKMWSELK